MDSALPMNVMLATQRQEAVRRAVTRYVIDHETVVDDGRSIERWDQDHKDNLIAVFHAVVDDDPGPLAVCLSVTFQPSTALITRVDGWTLESYAAVGSVPSTFFDEEQALHEQNLLRQTLKTLAVLDSPLLPVPRATRACAKPRL